MRFVLNGPAGEMALLDLPLAFKAPFITWLPLFTANHERIVPKLAPFS
jgi:hypothetical protein